MNKFWDKILDLMFPKHTTCIVCNNELNHNDDIEICDDCKAKLPYANGKTCERCGMSISGPARVCLRCKDGKKTFKRCFAPFDYCDHMIKLVHDLKYNNKKYIASTFGKMLYDCYEDNKFDFDFIIPVPLHETRFKKRGYNQSELIANNFAKYVNKQVRTDVLERVKQTSTQVGLSYLDRQENLKDAFKVTNRKGLKDKVVLLVDDVFTTGATASNCSVALLNAGAKAVYVLCVAHTVV